MVLDGFKDTGSVAQNALRLGFQKTCTAGLERLMKVDDQTTEACQDFLDRHLKRVNELTNNHSFIRKIESNYEQEFHDEYSAECYFGYPTIKQPISLFKSLMYSIRRDAQESRKFEAKVVKVDQPELDVARGMWKSDVHLDVIKHRWEGWRHGKYKHYPEEVGYTTKTITTNAVKAKLNFTPYDEYTEYLPDEATQAAYEAKIIGLENLQVVTVKTKVVNPDPIIIGYIGREMFLIAWVGYDIKNPLSCNV